MTVVFNRSNDEEAVRSDVVRVGDVPNTLTPVPVSSVRVLRSTLEAPEYTIFLLLSVRANRFAVPPPRLIVGSESVVVSELESIIIFPVVFPPIVNVLFSVV